MLHENLVQPIDVKHSRPRQLHISSPHFHSRILREYTKRVPAKSFVTSRFSVVDGLAYLIWTHRIRLPDIMGRSESCHIYSVGRDIKQGSNYLMVSEAKPYMIETDVHFRANRLFP